MFDIDDRSWIPRSIIAASASAEILFSLTNEFSKDPWGGDEHDVIALPAPPIAALDLNNLTSKEVLDHERELAEHYKAVLRLARQYGQSYNEFSLHFWLRLHLEWEGGVLGFPWYDTLDQMEQLFDWLLSAADGDDWSDVEQGWEMIAVRIASRFHFREGGFDQGGEYVNVALPRDPLLLSISNLRERARLVVARLTAEIGEDYWTRHRYDLRTDLDMKS